MSARDLHQQALTARESELPLESLLLNTQAMVSYQEEGDLAGFAEVLADRSITLRHLFGKTNDKSYLLLAKAELEAAVEIAKQSQIAEALAMPLFQLARVLEELKQFEEATKIYQQALSEMEHNPPKNHTNHPAILADIKVHLYTCSYKAGHEEALEKAKTALKELEQTAEEDSFNKHVWVSGGYMRLAEILKTKAPEEAKAAFSKAKEIIDSDSRLVVRKIQWQKMAELFSKDKD